MKSLILLFISCQVVCGAIPTKNLSQKDILALTIYKESNGEGFMGMKAVASVIKNRTKGSNYKATCLKPWQFSCWNGVQTVKVPNDKAWAYCNKLASDIVNNKFRSSHNYTQYYNPKLCSPKWANKLKIKACIGNHIFGKF